MSERVVVWQNSSFETDVRAQDPRDEGDETLHRVEDVRFLTPYGMMLTSLGSCTAIVLHTYAQHHGVALDEVETDVRYGRIYAEDCEDCDEVDEYSEGIEMEISLVGNLTDEERRRLEAVSGSCPVHKILAHGVEVRTSMAERA